MDKQRIRTFLLGGVVGALAGVILSPRSGRELRGAFADRAGEARERGRERYFEAQERLQERISESRAGSRRPPDVERNVERETPSSASDFGARDRPPLRDVSRDVYEGDAGRDESSAARAEDLRAKVRQTRDRLRRRIDEVGHEPGADSDE